MLAQRRARDGSGASPSGASRRLAVDSSPAMRWSCGSIMMAPSLLVRRAGRLLLGAALLLLSAGCGRSCVDAQGTAAAGSGAATATGSSAPTAGAAAASGGGGPLVLRGGASLQLPAGVETARIPGGLSDAAGVAHAFKLPGGRRRLVVSELPLGGLTCREKLDEDVARMKGAQTETDPQRLALRRVNLIEDRVVGGHRVLYTESMQGTSLADAGAPFAAVASATMCEGEDLLLMVYVSDEGRLDPAIKPMLDALVASYRPAARAP